MQIEKIRGLIAAPFTPMNQDGSLNLSIIPKYYELLKANRVSGAFICGSTGEGVSLTKEEKMLVAEAWALCSREDADFKVITLLGGTCIADCISLAKHAEQIGLYGVAFTAPFYFKPSSASVLAACCKQIADEIPSMPFYYYHIPVLTGGNYRMIDLLQQVDGLIPNFAGIKYTHEDFMDFLSCMNYADGKYDMLWGRDENMLPALSIGARGAVGSTFNYAAPLYHDLISAFEERKLELASRLQQQSIDMITLLGKYGGIATGKAYMKLVGIDCGEFRLPVSNMSASSFSQFKEEVEGQGFYSFCSKNNAVISS